MNNVSKWIVVPYVKPIERPADARIVDLDNLMTSIMANPKLTIEEKVREYNQAIMRFETFFDPNTYGESSTMLNMASTIKC
jgi:hypothetical protein